MNHPSSNQTDADTVTIYCTQCGQALRVAGEHVAMKVACPHCQTPLEPWRVAGAIPKDATLTEPFPPPPPVYYAHPLGYPRRASSRSKVVAGVLGILLGGLGVHRFYLGYIGIGILQIVVTVGTGGLGAMWGFIEGILCLTGNMRDVDDLPLRD